MKGLLVTLPVRRAAAALALGAALVTAGCGTTEAGRAATVDGRVITESQVNTARTEINKAFPDANLTASDVLYRLIEAPYVIDYVAKQGAPQSASVARANFPATADPSDEAIELLRGQYARQVLQQAGQTLPAEAMAGVKVVVNPRYGTFDPSKTELTPSRPDWLESSTTK
ncbi:hypothetical protein [Phycicoccus sonneratiae]|uniref:Lipoprotein n=1 Tax=Phycicoccus sonneratiae TaxID=2807628 RepID=A0ABS2CSC8_9MICO|nr:hypothetical protein [Phycicoccus sonneraticus]MBM6402071.1 hypothetical protein [Phycicoccus sonneraticus]